MKKKSSDKASDDKKQPPAFIKEKMDKKSADDEDECNKGMGDADGDDDDDDDGDDEDDVSKKAKKSLSPATLRKSMDILNALAEQSSETREQALGRKLSKGNISAAERAEFSEILSKSQDDASEGESDSLRKSLEDNQHEDYFAAEPYIREHAELVAKSIDGLNKSLVHIKENQDGFNSALVKALSNIGEVSARLLERMDAVENQPARVSKSQAVAEKLQTKVLEKSAMNQHESSGDNNTLSKSGTMDVLEQLNKSSLTTDNPGFSEHGGSYLAAIAQFENSNYLEAGMANEVVQFARAQRAS